MLVSRSKALHIQSSPQLYTFIRDGNHPCRTPSALTKIWKLCLMFEGLWDMYNVVGRFTAMFSSEIGGCDRMKTPPFFHLIDADRFQWL